MEITFTLNSKSGRCSKGKPQTFHMQCINIKVSGRGKGYCMCVDFQVANPEVYHSIPE